MTLPDGLFSRYNDTVRDTLKPIREQYPGLSEDMLVLVHEMRQHTYDLHTMIAALEMSVLNVQAYVISTMGENPQKNAPKYPKKPQKRQSLTARSAHRVPSLVVGDAPILPRRVANA